MDAVHLANKPLHVRVTITPQTINRQTEIAEYVCQRLRPQEIHVEAVYAVDGIDGLEGSKKGLASKKMDFSISIENVIVNRHGRGFRKRVWRHNLQSWSVKMRMKRPPDMENAFCCKKRGASDRFRGVCFIMVLWLRKSWPQNCIFPHLDRKLFSEHD